MRWGIRLAGLVLVVILTLMLVSLHRQLRKLATQPVPSSAR